MASVLITGGARSGKSTLAVRMAGEAAADALGRANIAIGQRMDRIVLAVAGRMVEATAL